MNSNIAIFKYKFFVYLIFVLLANSSFADTPNTGVIRSPQLQVEYCQSKAALNSIRDATQCHYGSQYSPLNSNFGESARWIRIQIQSDRANTESFAIRVGPYFLKEIELFRLTAQGWISEQAGSRLSGSQPHGNIGGYLFLMPPSPENMNTYYLKVRASSLTHIAVSANPWPNSNLRSSEHLLGIGTQIGILIAIFAFSIVSLGLSPSTVMARFSVSVANLILCLLSGSGILAIYLFPQEPLLNELIFNWALCLRLGLWIWVSQAFLTTYKTPNWYKASCWVIYCLVGISMMLIGIGKSNISNGLMLTGIILAPITQIIAIIKTPNMRGSFQTALISGFCISIILIILAVLAVLFPIQNNSQAPIYLSRLADFVNPLVMLSIIVFQNRLVRTELTEVKTALTETQLRSEYEGKLLKDRRTLIDMLAHELKNPLASIGLAIDTLSQSIDTNNAHDQRRLKNINRSILNMDGIIERCNLMNLIDQKSLPLSSSEIYLHAFITSIVENLHCDQQVNIDIPNDLIINTDPQFLQIILSNLIENGLKYSPTSCKLRIVARPFTADHHPHIRITIANPVQQDLAPDPQSVFQRFYRHPLAQKTRGSGLGLYICKELCSLLGGQIEYQYINNEAIFVIELPQ